MTGLLIHDDAAEVVGDLELLVHSEGAGVDAVDDGAAVGPVLGHGDPDVCAVEVNAARVVHVALTESDVLLGVAGLIHDKQVADSLARCAIVATCGVGYFTVGSRIWTVDRKMWSGVKAMPSVWNVGKLSFSLPVSCQLVLRSTPLKSSARAVLPAWWSPAPAAYAAAVPPMASAPMTVAITAAKTPRVPVVLMGCLSRVGQL